MPIPKFEPTKSPLDALSNALNIANNIYGIKANSLALERAKREQAAQEDVNQGIMNKSELFKGIDNFEISSKDDKESIPFKVRDGESIKEVHLKPRKKVSGLYDLMLKELQIEKVKSDLAQNKRLPSDKVLAVNQGNSVPSMLSDVQNTISSNKDLFGPIMGRLKSANPYDERAQTVDAQVRSAAQSFGRYMEGGVLRKEDEDKYRKMFPQLSDTPEVANNKLVLVDRLLKQKQASDVKALEESGFDVSGVNKQLSAPEVPNILSISKDKKSTLIPEASAGLEKYKPSDKDIQAMKWLKENPKHPDAPAVKAILRSKGL